MYRPSPFRLLTAGALVAALVPSTLLANSAPVVTNVTATQVQNTGQVRVTFDVGDADGDQVTARLICSSDNGVTFDLLPVTLSGDVNHQMAAGPGKQIVWDAGKDYPGRYWPQVVAKVIASDGPATSGQMVLVPAGSFTMGNNTWMPPVRTVYLDAYYIDQYEVTNAEFQQFILAGGYDTQAFWSAAGWSWRQANAIAQPLNWGDPSYHTGSAYPGFPVLGVSWYEAEAYANFAGKRLPTEAEWEKAARGTDARTYPWGEDFTNQRLNYAGSLDPYDNWTTPVGYYDGTIQPNPPFQTLSGAGPYGTYDQAGNAQEWVRDWYAAYDPNDLNNPLGPASGAYKVARGGNFTTQGCANTYWYLFPATFWRDGAVFDGCFYFYTGPDLRRMALGFRCARSAP